MVEPAAIHAREARETIPLIVNFYLAALHLLLSLYQLFFLPLFLLPESLWWALTLVPVALLSNSYWSVIHETIHDLFSPSGRANLAAGRLLGIFFGSPFPVLRIGHLIHHRLNRTPIEGAELYDPKKTSKMKAGLGYYFQILGGLYLFEVLSPLPFLLPRRWLDFLQRRFFSRETLSGLFWKSLVNDEAIRTIRTDGSAALALLCLSAACYGENWKLLLGAFLMRAFLISFLDNVYHYGTPVNDIPYARNLRLPVFLARAMLHFNLHGVHHRNPAIPWSRLAAVFGNESGPFDSGFFASAARQLRGPIAISDLVSGRAGGAGSKTRESAMGGGIRP